MQEKKRSTMKFSLIGLTLTLLISCVARQGSSPVVSPEPNLDIHSPSPDSSTVKEEQAGLFVAGQLVSFGTATASQIRSILGNPEKSYQDVSGDYIDEYNGLKYYYLKDLNSVYNDRIDNVIITSPDYSIVGGGKVGDPGDQILARYPNGFFNQANENSEDGKKYYMKLNLSADKSHGVGFMFILGKDKVVEAINIQDFSLEK